VNMGMPPGGAPSLYGPAMTGKNPRSMSPGPGMMSPTRPGQGFQPGPGYGPPPLRPQMMPPQGSFNNNGPAGIPGLAQGGGWNMANAQQWQGPLPSPMGMGRGGLGSRPQTPGFQLPPQGHYSPVGSPGGPRPGTPGRMQYQGQAF
jgi:CCR4-NOT transcriptional complex subunit CAF120